MVANYGATINYPDARQTDFCVRSCSTLVACTLVKMANYQVFEHMLGWLDRDVLQRVGCHLCPELDEGDEWGLISSSPFFPFPVSHFVVLVSKALTSSGKAWRWTCVQLTPPRFPPGPKDVGYRLTPISLVLAGVL